MERASRAQRIDKKAGIKIVAWLDVNGRIASSDEDSFEDRLIDAGEHLGRNMAQELVGAGS
jgi:hypothetical protein